MATKKISEFYIRQAIKQLVLAIDDYSMFCKVISETEEGVSYRVEIDEETMTSKSCSCPSRCSCKHRQVVDRAFASYSTPKEEEAPVVEETTIFEVERKSWYIVNHQYQVWLQDGKWMCANGAKFVEMVKAHLGIQDEPPKVVDIGSRGTLNGNRGFDLMKRAV